MPIRELVEVIAWDAPPGATAAHALDCVERGEVLWFPRLAFDLSDEEQGLLRPTVSDGRSKNISFDPVSGRLAGTALQDGERDALAMLLRRFAERARALVDGLFPLYKPKLEPRLVSYRPVDVTGRETSPKKDDTRLHVDAFASRPNQGRRILRVFTNLNPRGEPRVWEIGEPFEIFAARFTPQVPRYSATLAWLLERLHVTKSRRTEYDHLMLHLHDLAKLDQHYQRTGDKTRFGFPPRTTWICFSDQVLHAALAGQYMMEQTFFLPVAGMAQPQRSPLRILEGQLGRTLVQT